MAARMTMAGEILHNQMSNTVATGMMAVFQVILADLIMRREGARIKATTQGRMPLKMRSTTGRSRYSRNTVANSRMMTMEGMMAPSMAATAPFRPSIVCPTYNAVFTAKTKAGLAYVRFYFNPPGWWNTRSYVVRRIKAALN